MSTVSDKLSYLNETKSQIRQAIQSKGVEVSETDTFRSYAEKVGEITGGGSGTEYPTIKINVYNGAVANCARSGDVVTLHVTGLNPSGTSFGAGTIPEDYRPLAQVQSAVTVSSAYQVSATGSTIAVSPDGTFGCNGQLTSGGESSKLGVSSMSISYIAANAVITEA